MVLQKFVEVLYLQVEEQTSQLESFSQPIQRLKNELAIVQKALAELKVEVDKSGFIDRDEEIFFFKVGKPKIYALLIFFIERYTIETSTPLVGKKQQVLFFESQLNYINRFFRQNEFLFQYYHLNADDLDNQYFIRNIENSTLELTDVPPIDPSCSTVASYLFSKFIAYERIQKVLKEEIESRTLDGNEIKSNSKELKWTGEIVNIVELVYGIYETKQINDGKASISELMDVFGNVFQLNLTKYFKRFSDIKRRKSISKTKFLDDMQHKVNKRIEDSDAFIPEDQRAKYGY